ncbi:MAG: arsenate reductase ArsC [Thermodesulfobacteriota bacterium]
MAEEVRPKPQVLFLCTHNTARSQMAEALLKKYAGDRFEVYSAGFEPTEINPYTRKVMAEVGLDLGGQYAKGVKEYLGKINFAYVIIVCARAEKTCPTAFPSVLPQRLFWPFEDPAAFPGTEEEKLAKFRDIRDQIDRRLRQWLSEMP